MEAPRFRFVPSHCVAEALDLSPAELRRRWAYREGDATPTGQVLRSSVGAVAVLERAVEAGGFEAARARTRGGSGPDAIFPATSSLRSLANGAGKIPNRKQPKNFRRSAHGRRKTS